MGKDVKLIEAWIRALRSGKFKKNRGALKNKNGYCCLGVACAVELGRTRKKAATKFNAKDIKLAAGDENNAQICDADLRARLGLNVDKIALLQLVNDGNYTYNAILEGKRPSFKAIANYIETNILKA